MRHDITTRKRAEEDLAESESRLLEQKDLLEQTHDALFTWKLDDGVINWNKNAERLYGYTAAEVLGKEVYELLKAVYPISFDDYFAKLKKENRWEGELRQTTKDGKKIFVESRQVIFETREGKFIVLETSRDITERKLSDERIIQQASLLDKAQDAILVCDLNHRIIFWNKGAERVYGWKSEDVLGREIGPIIGEGDNGVIEKPSKTHPNSDEWLKETAHYTKDKSKIIVVSRWTLVRNEIGQPDYFLIINTDITNLKQAEEQLFRAQRMESIGTLAGGIAHDLNNVLSPILMSVEMLQSDELIDKGGEPWLSIIRENTERGASLLKQVLTSTALSIVKSHGGFINTYSEPGRGTRFSVYLPAIENENARTEITAPKLPFPTGGGELILIVDDEKNIRQVTSGTLEKYGYRTLTASNGAEAPAVYKQNVEKIAMVLTDMAMPLMDGATTIRALRKISPQLKIISASGLTSELTADINADAFLTKPYTAEKLLKTLAEILRK